MLERIIDIADTAAFLKVENHLLVIQAPGMTERQTVPLDEVGVLLLSNPAATLTHAVLSRLAANGAMVICCDEKHLPGGMLLPMQANGLQTRRMNCQAEAPQPLKKRLWQRIVAQKVRNQGALLKLLSGNDCRLAELADKVRSGDTENMEARAARIYWKKLAIVEKRERNGGDANPLLNYGYAVLLAACARALCAAGLHPSLGLYHHSACNPFCLASDVMEPFRPLVDEAAHRLVAEQDARELDAAAKRVLVNAILEGTVEINKKRERVIRSLSLCADSLARIYCGEGDARALLLPQY